MAENRAEYVSKTECVSTTSARSVADIFIGILRRMCFYAPRGYVTKAQCSLGSLKLDSPVAEF